MIRLAAAVVVALCVSTSPLYAQSAKLTVSAVSANVYKSPSVASPVIGKAPQGTSLDITREVGDWVKVAWPSSVEGFGYVRVSALAVARANAAPATGTRAAAAAKGTRGTTAAQTPAPAATATPAPTPITVSAVQAPIVKPSAPTPARPLYVAPTHTLGIGAMAGGSTMGFGASARAWRNGRLGMQLEVSRYTYDSTDLLSRATATDLAPSVLFAMRDHVSDYLWLRPYVGAGAHIGHSSRTDLIFPDATESANTIGARVFFGGEMSFSSLPQFAVSADIGYYHLPEPFVGFEPGGVGFSVSGHWYVK